MQKTPMMRGAVGVLVAFIIGLFFLTRGSDEVEDPCVATGMCEYNAMIEKQKTLAEKAKLLEGEVAVEKAEYEAKLIEYQIVMREYEQVKADADTFLNKEHTEEDIERIEYQAEFLAYLDYEVPVYDPNLLTGVTFNAGTSEEKLRIMNIAYQLGGDEFVLMLHAENQHWDHTKQSDCHGRLCEGPESGKAREQSYGYCQLNINSYREFLNSKYFKDPEAQVVKCWNEYKKAKDNGSIATKFYGRNNRELYRNRFTFGQ